MTPTLSASLPQVWVDETHPFITVITPQDASGDLLLLMALWQNHHQRFMELLTRRGVVLFRGFAPANPEAFTEFVTSGLGMPSWNAFNLKGMPAFMSNWLRRYTENLVGGGDYRRYLSNHTVQLGPVEAAVQGPHVEGGGSPRRSRHLALCCFQPSDHLAETGMVDLHAVFEALPAERKTRYLNSFNRFYYLTSRPLRLLDRLIVSQSPVQPVEKLPDGRVKLASPVTPMVCAHPETGLPCLQPWAFAQNTNPHVFESAVAHFPDRGISHRCSNAEQTQLRWDLCDEQGRSVGWSDAEQREMFDTIFDRAHLLNWQKGDIAVVDNIRIGHWRMNGEQGQRKLVQVQLDSFNAMDIRALPHQLGSHQRRAA
jgi:Taurine catabolism dioxygenase TauD, TfdA family